MNILKHFRMIGPETTKEFDIEDKTKMLMIESLLKHKKY